MANQIEHANIRVKDIDQTVKFLTTALLNFIVRGGNTSEGNRWLHVGTDSTYLALSERSCDEQNRELDLIHIGFVVDDVDAVRQRLEQAGYSEGMVVDPHPYRKRIYFLDNNNMEWEFVEYFSDNPSERNEYS